MTEKQIVVIGGGASGLMAAGRAAESGAKVLLLEKMPEPGKKILISGKTRCNLTNTAELDRFISMYGRNGRFLYQAFSRFFRDDLLVFFRCYGVETKIERGGRIFPASDDAHDVVKAFGKYLADNRVKVQTGVCVKIIEIHNRTVTGVRTDSGFIPATAIILAAGGGSYPATGSTGDGYKIAEALGHTIIKLRPALVPLVVKEVELAKNMQGVSLKNVRLTAFSCPADEIDTSLTPKHDYGRGTGHEKAGPPVIESRLGEMMFTHFGIGGPITLQMSLAVADALDKGPVGASLDLKPGLTGEQLRRRLQRDFETYSKRSYRNLLKELLPQKMIDPFIGLTGIAADKPAYQISVEEREKIMRALKSLRFNVKSPLPLSSAMVTAGGISLKEIDPYTMASRLAKGLYFCGEVMDIDAETGGYNLQAAFSTGFVAGESAAEFVKGGD